jgi:periplasmic copper chaperone A
LAQGQGGISTAAINIASQKRTFRVKTAYVMAACTILALSACGKQETAAPQATEAAEPDAKPGLAVAAARLVLPAVSGNPGAAYFMLDNRTAKAVRIAAVSIDGAAKTEVHQTKADSMASVDAVEVAAGTSIAFAPGKLHVMVFNIDPKLKAGGTSEMTLTFADGDKLSVPLTIETPGGMADHGDMH